MAAKTERSWNRLGGLIAVLLFIQGCGLSPGIQVKAGPSRFFSFTRLVDPVEEENYILIPVTPRVVEELESASSIRRSEIPKEWIVDSSNYNYRIGPLDVLHVIVWDHPELSTTAAMGNIADEGEATNGAIDGVRVNRDGKIFFPLAGEISVAGRNVQEVRELLTYSLGRYLADPQLDVQVVGFRSQKVQVTGEVGKATEVAVTDRPLRLLDAIGAAGGTTALSDFEDVRIVRNGRQVRINLLEIYDHGQLEHNILLQDGDLVHVGNMNIKKVFVMGEVKRPGVTALERGQLTLATAIQSSSGVNQDTADAGRIMVLRQGREKPLIYFLNANEPDSLVLSTRFPLEQSDIVYVSTSELYRFRKVVEALLSPFVRAASLATVAAIY